MIERIFKDKISCIFLSLVISLNLLGFYSFLLLPAIASAQQTENSEDYCQDLTVPDPQNAGERIDRYIELGIPIPGFTQTIDDKNGNKIHVVKDLSCYIYYFYKYFASVVGILAAVMIIWGGFRYLTSFGNPSRISVAKEQITSAIIGLFITLGTYVILFTINPSIVNLRMPYLKSIKQLKQNTIWCADSMDVYGPTQECGAAGKTPDGQLCYWHDCKDNKICVLDKKFECQDAKLSCARVTNQSKCAEVDKALVREGINDYACRPIPDIYKLPNGYNMKTVCSYGKVLKCPDGYKITSCISCGGNCWDDQKNEPKGNCKDSETRAIEKKESICCITIDAPKVTECVSENK